MQLPIEYDALQQAGTPPAPAGVNLVDNATTAFYTRYLMKRAISAIKLTIPESWPLNYVSYVLFALGFGAVLEIPRYGVIFQGGSLYGRDVFYQPARFITANPLFDTPGDGWKIGRDCEIIKLQPDYSGLHDVVIAYANRLALAYEAWNMNTQNSKFAYVFTGDNKSQAATFEKLFDVIQSGRPAVATGNGMIDKDGKPRWQPFVNDLRANYIAPEISEDMRTILNEFDGFVGIPNDPQHNKRERVVVDQVNANNVETDTLLDLMVLTLNEGMEKANRRFGLQLKAEKKYPMLQTTGGDQDGESVDPRAV